MSVQSTLPYTVNLSPAKNCEKVALILTYEWKKMGKEEKKGKIKKTTKYQPFRILKLQALENTLICYSTLKHATLCPNGELLDF